jgi:Undecaprenyl-phosphate glucose phosphotransferase
MYTYRKFLLSVRLVADSATIVLSCELAVLLSYLHVGGRAHQYFYLILPLLLLVWVVSSQVTHLYDDFRSRDFGYEVVVILKNVIVQAVAAAVIFIIIKETFLSRFFLLTYSAILFALLFVEKYILRSGLKVIRRKGRNLRSILVIGAGRVGHGFAQSVEKHPQFGYRIVGFLDDKKKQSLNGNYLGPISKLETILSDHRVDNVVIALPNYAYGKVEEIINTCEKFTTTVRIIPDYFQIVSPRYNFSMFDRYPLISLREEKLNEFHWRIVKRTFDTAFSVALFVFLFWWLWPLIALAIKLTSPGPIFFKQTREGRNNKKFVVYKFRSMLISSSDVDQEGNYNQASKDDPRITAIGKILRKTNMDELPQFLNVLKGEMSVVGPRPHPIPLDLKSKGQTQKYMQRYLVKPGITGWAQVNGHRGETRDSGTMQKRINFDLWYIENWSFWLDIQIIFKTLWLTVKGDPQAY